MKRKLINWYRTLTQTKMPDFRNLTQYHVPSKCFYGYTNPIFLTPRYQKIPYSEELLKYIRYMQRKNSVSYADMKVFVEHVLV
jgi:hypothetical protein